MRERLQFVGGPRDGEWITLHEGRHAEYRVPADPGLIQVFDGPAVPSGIGFAFHKYERALWRLDEGSKQYCLRYVGRFPEQP